MVNVGSVYTGPTHGEVRLQPHPGDVLKSTPNVRKSPGSGMNLEGKVSDTQIVFGYFSSKTRFVVLKKVGRTVGTASIDDD